MKKHITMVAALHMGLGALGLIIAVFLFLLLFGVGIASGDRTAMPVLAITATATAIFLILLSAPGLIGGIGLLKMKPWGRILVLAVSVFQVMNIPLGTAIGVYSFWVLIQDATEALFAGEQAPPRPRPEAPLPARLPDDPEA